VSGLPFSAVVGQDDARLALLLGAVDPGIGGVLLTGEKGTAKTTLVRALAGILPGISVVAKCRFSCDPADPDPGCPDGPHPPGCAAGHRAAAIRLVSSRSAAAWASVLAAGKRSWSSRARTMAARRAGSALATTGTHRPNRSSSCGRSSPSSGFMVPTSRNLEACRSEIPSRSTLALPVAAASSRTSTIWSGSRLISSK
jgi:energy-coupling factor transporter ATP-binding protein EcfA2